jgi:Bacterial aa3 type cytochrome c oxidase subunit IV
LLEEEENFTLLIKKIQSLKHVKVSNFMDINPQKETWSNFKKLTVYISLAIILVLALMAIFLL